LRPGLRLNGDSEKEYEWCIEQIARAVAGCG